MAIFPLNRNGLKLRKFSGFCLLRVNVFYVIFRSFKHGSLSFMIYSSSRTCKYIYSTCYKTRCQFKIDGIKKLLCLMMAMNTGKFHKGLVQPLKSVHFKNTVTRSSVLSKLWSFSIIHQLTLFWFQLMYYRKRS